MNQKPSVKEASYRIQRFMKHLRDLTKEKAPRNFSPESPVFTEERRSLLEEGYVKRLVIFLRGTGCRLVELTGGCTFCGFYHATNLGEKITDEQYIHQVKSVLEDKTIDISQYKVICIYNDGSLFSEQEIAFEALCEIFRILSAIPTLRRIVIESKIQDLSLSKIQALRKTTDKEIEIAFGFESSNPLIRRLCINKNFNNYKVMKLMNLMDINGILPVSLMMAKPPFLTEEEATIDIIHSLLFLQNSNVHRIDIELPTIVEKTLTHMLWKQGYYKPIQLPSVLKIMEKAASIGITKKIYISPPSYSVPSIDKTHTDAEVDNLFELFNHTQNFELFRSFSLKHKFEETEMKFDREFGSLTLIDRIDKLLNILEPELNSELNNNRTHQ